VAANGSAANFSDAGLQTRYWNFVMPSIDASTHQDFARIVRLIGSEPHQTR
jgi:hypothetical protein